jgi:hypothetical protein
MSFDPMGYPQFDDCTEIADGQKDAEIERLKELITELADALEGMKPISSMSPVTSELEKEKLLQRAREATR